MYADSGETMPSNEETGAIDIAPQLFWVLIILFGSGMFSIGVEIFPMEKFLEIFCFAVILPGIFILLIKIFRSTENSNA